jgi:hypothetical protein
MNIQHPSRVTEVVPAHNDASNVEYNSFDRVCHKGSIAKDESRFVRTRL